MRGQSYLPESARLDAELRRELIAGERVVWSAQPDPKRMRAVFWAWAFAIPWTAFSIGWTGIAATAVFAGAFQDESGFSWWAILFPMFGLPFVGIGLWMLNKPFVVLADARHTLHALTDRRIMTLTVRKEKSIKSAEISTFGQVTRKEKPDGWGSLTIETGSHIDSDGDRITEKFELYGIPEVAKLERLLREAQQAR
jgi:hypothetical protein